MIASAAAIRRVVAALAVACALAACSSPEEKVDEHLARAEALLASGDQKAAVIELRLALQAAPQRGDLNLRIARLFARDETKQADALFFYQEAYRLDPSLDDARLAAAEILAPTDRAQAKSLVQQALERDAANARAHGLLSRLALLDNDLDAALASAMTAVELAPEDAETQLRLARVYQARIQIEQTSGRVPDDSLFRSAVEALDKSDALSEQAGDLDARILAQFERARVQAAWPGHTTEAKESYLELIDLAGSGGDPKRMRAAGEMAFSFAVATNDDDVIHDVLERMVERDPGNLLSWASLATHERRQGRSDEAVFQRMLEKQPRSAAAHVIRADARHARGDTAGAISGLEEAVGQVDQPSSVQLALVDLLYAVGRTDEATRLVERMQGESPEDPSVRLAGALRAMREQRLEDAVALLNVVAAESESLRAQEMLAEAQLRLGNLEAATQAVDRGVQIGQGRWAAGHALRLAIQRVARDWQGLLRSAREIQNNGRTLNPEQQLAVIEALYETGQAGEARQRLDLLLAASNAPPAARLLYAQRESAANPARVRQLLEEGLAADPDARALLQQLALLDAQEGHLDQALARLDAYLAGRAADDAPGVRLLRARLRAQTGELSGAEQDALAAFRAAPQLPGAAELVAAIYVEQGKTAEAIQSFEAALADGSLPRPARVVLARFYTAEGRDDDAIRVLEEVVGEGGGPPAKNDLAFLLARDKRDLERALTLAQEAVGSGMEQPTFFDTLGFVFLQKGLYGPALDQFEQAIELAQRQNHPRAEYLFRKGLALQGLGRPAEAVKAFEAALSLDPAFSEAGEARASLEKARAAAESGGS